MPLEIVDAVTAFAHGRDHNSLWPRSRKAQAARLDGIAKPSFHPSFQISKADRIFATGSCFARNIENQLMRLGMNVAAADIVRAGNRRDSPIGMGTLNKFVVHSIEQEFRWALDPETRFPDETLRKTSGDRYVDPHLGAALMPLSLGETRARRAMVSRYFASVAQADVVIITLGLAEAWYDTRAGVYLNIAPERNLSESDLERLQFHILSYDDILASLERIRTLLDAHLKPAWKMLITVSPVALSFTFSGRDALVANTYSKAVQRAAVEVFVRRHDSIDYFPSFESVWLSGRDVAWEEDQLHVSNLAVRSNMLRMLQAYAPGLVTPIGASDDDCMRALAHIESAAQLNRDGDIEGAVAEYETAFDLAAIPGAFRLYGWLLLRLQRNDRAVEMLEKALLVSGPGFGIELPLALALTRLRQNERAYPLAMDALSQEPDRPAAITLGVRLLCWAGKTDNAANLLDRLRGLEPDHPELLKLSKQISDRGKTTSIE